MVVNAIIGLVILVLFLFAVQHALKKGHCSGCGGCGGHDCGCGKGDDCRCGNEGDSQSKTSK